MNSKKNILICDDDRLVHLTLKHILQNSYIFHSAYNADEATLHLKKTPIDILLLDINLRTAEEGLNSIPRFKEIDPEIAIIMISGRTDFESVRAAMRLGADDYVPKEFDKDDLEHTIHRVLERKNLRTQKEQQNFEVQTQQKRYPMIGSSPAIQNLKNTITKLQGSRANVLITGETGTGKEVVARQIRGTLPDGSLIPFVAIDSSTIQNTTAESLLFGHERGSFTGAEKTQKGVFEEANGGIVYFDEIGNMPLEIQSKLLRVLQEKEITRLGSTKIIPLDFRVIAASNRDLEFLISQNLFKADLLQRLNTIPVFIPPLRERKEDIPELLEHFIHQNAKKIKFTKEATQLLQAHLWPGNVRELSNLVAYLTTMAEVEEIDICDLPPKLRDSLITPHKTNGALTFYNQVETYEKEILTQEFGHNHNISQLAIKLGMDRSHLHNKLKMYGIKTL